MDDKMIGRNIQTVRKGQRLTQKELAYLVGIEPKYLSNIESGRNHCGIQCLIKIANALSVDSNTLLGEVLDVMKKKPPESAEAISQKMLINRIKNLSSFQCELLMQLLTLMEQWNNID